MGRKAQLTHGLGKHRRHLPVAVDHENMLGLGLLEMADPVQQMVVVGVGAEALEIHHLGPDRHVLAEQLHGGHPVQQGPAQGARGLEAHEHHGTVRPPQVILQMVADAARVAHTGGGDDDLGGVVLVQGLGLVHGLRQMQAREVEHMGAVLHQLQSVLVQIAPQIAAENGGGAFGQGTVHVHGEIRHGGHQALILDLPDEIQQLLGAAHGKGGNHHVAALAQSLVDDLGQLAGIAPHLCVVAVTVGALHDHIVRPGEELGVPDDGLVHVADIAGKDDGFRLASLGEGQADGRGAQQMARVDEHGVHPVAQVDGLVIFAGVNKLRHPLGVGHGIQRLLLRPPGPAVLAIFILGVALLDVGGVLEHDAHELSREPGGENAALEAVFDEHGHPAGVVDVGVGDEHIVDAARGKGQGAVVHLVPALLQSAVDEDALAAYLQTMAAAGDTLVSAEKTQLHGIRPFLSKSW